MAMVDAVEFGPVGGLGGFGLGVGVGEDVQRGQARGGGGGGERDRGNDGERDRAGADGPGAVGGGGGDEEEVGALQIDGIGRVAVAEVDDGQAGADGDRAVSVGGPEGDVGLVGRHQEVVADEGEEAGAGLADGDLPAQRRGSIRASRAWIWASWVRIRATRRARVAAMASGAKGVWTRTLRVRVERGSGLDSRMVIKASRAAWGSSRAKACSMGVRSGGDHEGRHAGERGWRQRRGDGSSSALTG